MTNSSLSDLPDPCSFVPVCPICEAGPMTFARHFEGVAICVCETCETTLSVPNEALQKRAQRD